MYFLYSLGSNLRISSANVPSITVPSRPVGTYLGCWLLPRIFLPWHQLCTTTSLLLVILLGN